MFKNVRIVNNEERKKLLKRNCNEEKAKKKEEKKRFFVSMTSFSFRIGALKPIKQMITRKFLLKL
jgi:hypothetical protein